MDTLEFFQESRKAVKEGGSDKVLWLQDSPCPNCDIPQVCTGLITVNGREVQAYYCVACGNNNFKIPESPEASSTEQETSC